jgi:choline dehydrogenase
MSAETRTYDYIIVGAGSAGAVIASRLAEGAPTKSVLLVEAGGPPNNLWLKIPLGVGKVLQDDRYIWRFNSEPQNFLNGRVIYSPRGKVLGGSSSVNGLIYVIGDPKRYDLWESLNCPGWRYKDVSPFFLKIENYLGKKHENRGEGGPLTISKIKIKDELSERFISALHQIGCTLVEDYNTNDLSGVGYLQLTVKNGLRASVATAYLQPNEQLKNLQVMTKSVVTKVLIENQTARGVKVSREGQETDIFAREEVILSAGAFQSPKILELSGVGDPVILNKNGIQLKLNLPGVGEGLQDHLNIRVSYECTKKITINDALNNPWYGLKMLFKYIIFKGGLIATPSATVQAIIKSDTFIEAPDLKIQLVHLSEKGRFAVAPGSGVDKFSGFSIGTFPMYPHSKGSVHITSSCPFDPPAIDPNYLSDARDVELTLKGIKIIRQIGEQPPIKKIAIRETAPGINVKSDEELIHYIRSAGQSTYHSIGTCKMGSDRLSVVDHKFKVHGINKLRVADASVMPILVSPNINAAAIMIGERAAHFILNPSS